MTVRGGRYEMLRVIASGGMATVHLGRALGAGGFERLVAIKVMHTDLAEEPEFVAMFLDEGRLAARIRHPNVVGTLDIQQDEQGLFLVMEYVEGPSLHRVLRALAKKQQGLPLDVTLRIFVDALAGLHAAHELRGANGEPLRLVHRDVSPQNVLISVDGVAQITDFGVARAESRLQTTRTGVLKGKVCYMAPEQILSDPVDRRTDVYAAGALLWQLLTGQRLIRGDDDDAMMDRILRGRHPSPREVIPSIPEALSLACMDALAQSPADRPPTAAAFAEAIEAAAEAEGIPIATPRALSAFIKDLGLDRTEGPSQPLVDGSQPAHPPAESLAVPAPSSNLRARASSAAIAVPSSSGQLPDFTNAAVLAPSREPKPHRAGAVRWVGGVLAFLTGAAAAWLLFTRGPLKVSWREEAAASAAAAQPPAAASTSALEPGGLLSTVAPAPSTRSVTPSAALPSASAAPAPKPPVHDANRERAKPEASPAAFRPTDL